MNQEVCNNVVSMDFIYSTAVSQVNMATDNIYFSIIKWINDCTSTHSFEKEYVIQRYETYIDTNTTPPEELAASEDAANLNRKDDDNDDGYDGESVDMLIEKYRKLTVADLKKEMKKVGLKPRGLKRDLVKQLADKHYQQQYDNWKKNKALSQSVKSDSPKKVIEEVPPESPKVVHKDVSRTSLTILTPVKTVPGIQSPSLLSLADSVKAFPPSSLTSPNSVKRPPVKETPISPLKSPKTLPPTKVTKVETPQPVMIATEVKNSSTKETPAAVKPAELSAVKAPVMEILPKETPAKEDSIKETPVKETPVKETPVKETSIIVETPPVAKKPAKTETPAVAPPSKLSTDEIIQNKTLTLLKRVEEMKKKKEERQGVPFLTKAKDAKSATHLSQMKEKDLSILAEELTLPKLTKEIDKPVNRSFISLVSPVPNRLQGQTPTHTQPPRAEGHRLLPRRVLVPPKESVKRDNPEGVREELKEKSVLLPTNFKPQQTQQPIQLPTQHTQQPTQTTQTTQQPTQPQRPSPQHTAHSESNRQSRKHNLPEDNGKMWYESPNIENYIHKQHKLLKYGLSFDMIFGEVSTDNIDEILPKLKENHRGSSGMWNS